MTTYNFDQVIPRRGTGAAKWDFFEPDVLPMWVADMDFRSPEPVIRALQERTTHGIFGYMMDSKSLREAICERMARLYQWTVTPEQILFIPGVVLGLSYAGKAYGEPGDNVLTLTPVYPPFLTVPVEHGQSVNGVEMVRHQSGSRLRYEIDFDAFEKAINDRTKLFIHCSPHNPVGRVWTRDELTRLAEICLKHNVILCADEIHCDLLLDGRQHVPLASLSPEIAAQTITLMAPSKTFNLPGLFCSFAIIQNEDLRNRYRKALGNLPPHVNVMGYTAAEAAYRDGGEWLEQLLRYLQANRDFVTDFVETHMPGIGITHPEGTYLAWLDCRAVLPKSDEAQKGNWIDQFFLKEAKVALNAGGVFGQGGEGFVRFNFGAPRSLLADALERMRMVVTAGVK